MTTTAQPTDTRRDEGKEGCCYGCDQLQGRYGCMVRAAQDPAYMQAAVAQQTWEAK
jgi:hypothetical protein